ncbi:hypothetical protein [Alicyclobacillus fastidiosus]|nr:hypothetical protein [Alicyclobacillus fastidiosus]
MRASQLTQLHESALLDKIVELYMKGTLATSSPFIGKISKQ